MDIRREKFCNEYVLNGGNGTKAVIAAGFGAAQAASFAWKLLKETEIQEEIAALREQAISSAEINREMLIQELKGIALSNVVDYLSINESGVDVRDIDNLPRYKQIAISEVSEQANDHGGSSVKFKLHPKVAAIERLLKIIGADGPQEGGNVPKGNTLEEGNFVLKRRKRKQDGN